MHIFDIRKNRPEWASHYYISNGDVIYTTPGKELDKIKNSISENGYMENLNEKMNAAIRGLIGTHTACNDYLLYIHDGVISMNTEPNNTSIETMIKTNLCSFSVFISGDFDKSMKERRNLEKFLEENEVGFNNYSDIINSVNDYIEQNKSSLDKQSIS